MGHAISETLAFCLADTLAMTIEYDRASNRVVGQQDRTVWVGPVPFEIKPKIAASRCFNDRILALVRVAGNLYVLVTVSIRRTRVYIINSAKFDGSLEADMFDGPVPDHKSIKAQLGASLVSTYERMDIDTKKDKKWQLM